MQKLLILLILCLVFITANGQIKKIDTEHFQVKYETEAEKYVLASLKVLELARTLAINNGYNLPDKLKFSVIRTDRNVLYFDRKNLKQITWEYTSLTNFLPPTESKKKNIYGLCHEIGHLCMYNTTNNKNNWMSYDYRESWADFFGNFIIDSIHHQLGNDFWPEPHNYTETAGIEFLIHRIEKDNPKLMSFNKSSLYWYDLNSKVGFRNINDFFAEINKQKVNNPNAKEKYVKILTLFIQENDLEEWFNKYAEYLILDKN